MDSYLVHMMVQIQDHQKDQLKELYFLFYSLTQGVQFFNIFCCAIFLSGIQRFVVLFSQSLHIQMGGSLQGCQFQDFFVHEFLKIKHFVPFIFLRQFFIISLLQFIIQLFLRIFYMAFKCLALDKNYPYYVIFGLFSDILSFGFYF